VRARFSSGLRTPADGAAGPPVLCVHGFHMNATSMWGLRRTLERHGHATRAVYLGLPYRRAEVYARSLAAALERLREETGGGRVDVVAHSMGGLVLRLVLSRRPDLAAAVRRVVTLGTPHHGTGLLPSRGRGPVSRMMSRGSAFLATLPPFAESAPVAAVTTIGSAHDLLVYPVDTVHLAAAQQVTLEGVGHLGMLTERRVRQRVAALLDAPDAEAGSGVTRRAGPVAR
jgi:pimeloyl-ACP methyl ester carboxylesterase